MKKQLYIMTATMILLAVSVVEPAKAQSSTRITLKATIPFAFSIGNRTLPAGEYIVVCINPASDQSVLQFRGKDGHAGMVQMRAVTGKASETAKLVFNRYGDQYFFTRAWTPNESNGLEAPRSRAERSMQRGLASAGQKSELVAVKAR